MTQKQKKLLQSLTLYRKILHNDDKIPKDINFLNSKQVLNVVQKWATIM